MHLRTCDIFEKINCRKKNLCFNCRNDQHGIRGWRDFKRVINFAMWISRQFFAKSEALASHPTDTK